MVTPLRVYVIGSSAEIERAESVIARLRSERIEITYDWPANVRQVRAAGYASDAALSDAAARDAAMRDVEGVDGADLVLLLAPAAPSFGAGFEFGVAFGGSQVGAIVCGPHARASIFTRLCGYVLDTDEAGIAEVLRLRDLVARAS